MARHCSGFIGDAGLEIPYRCRHDEAYIIAIRRSAQDKESRMAVRGAMQAESEAGRNAKFSWLMIRLIHEAPERSGQKPFQILPWRYWPLEGVVHEPTRWAARGEEAAPLIR